MDCKQLWAKSYEKEPGRYHPIWCHLLDVAAVCEGILPLFGGVPGLSAFWTVYLVALHDIGKADPFFQNKDLVLARRLRKAGVGLPDVQSSFRHEARSAEWLLRYLQRTTGWDRIAAIIVSQAIRGHHGNFAAKAERDETSQAADWSAVRDEIASVIGHELGITFAPGAGPTFDNASVTGVKLAGATVLSDWIASNSEVYHYDQLDVTVEPAQYLSCARSEAQRAIDHLQFRGGAAADPRTPAFREVWPACVDLRPSQKALEKACLIGIPPGLVFIEAPMGEGKTEAAIYLAECWNRAAGRSGAYIALPTQATSNQMYSRYAAHLRGHGASASPRLVHGMSWLMDKVSLAAVSRTYGPDEDLREERELSRDWFRNAKRALLAEEGVGTVDQVLMSVLHVKHGFLRLFGLSRKVLIIDEVHAYDEYMTVLMERLIQWCSAMRTPVIMLSATLSHNQKRRLAEAYRGPGVLPDTGGEDAPYPLITAVPLEGTCPPILVERNPETKANVELSLHYGLLNNLEGTAGLAGESIRDGGCACVLVNTVADAQKVFRSLVNLRKSGRLKGVKLCLFHARFPAGRRLQIERLVLKWFGKHKGKVANPHRPRCAILVATQVVEQSLDVDFDAMITQLAPIDLLLQRSGRLWRHDRGPRRTGAGPVLHVLLPAKGDFEVGRTSSNPHAVYHRYPLLRTLAFLDSKTAFCLPDDFRPLIEGCYGDSELPGGHVPQDLLNAAAADRANELAIAKRDAERHLIPRPSESDFSLGDVPVSAVSDDDEAGHNDYFHAQTRQGQDNRSVLILSDAAQAAAAQRPFPPEAAVLRSLFLCKAAIPRWWLVGVTAVEGNEAPSPGPRWLRGSVALTFRDGVWRGVTESGKAVAIRNDKVLGLVREEE